MIKTYYKVKETYGLSPAIWGPFETLEAAETKLAQLKRLTGVYVPWSVKVFKIEGETETEI